MAQMMRIPQMKQWFSIRVIRLIRAIRVLSSSQSALYSSAQAA
jgi:hypothetical protein